MRRLPTRKSVRGLFAAEGYLELWLPHRALRELDRIDDAGELEPYSFYLRGQALQQLDRYEEAIEALQEAARTIPAPFNQQVWEDLSHCFRQQGQEELADIAEVFADDPEGGADRDLAPFPFLADFEDEADDPWDRSGSVPPDDFEQYNFDDLGCDTTPPQKRPKK